MRHLHLSPQSKKTKKDRFLSSPLHRGIRGMNIERKKISANKLTLSWEAFQNRHCHWFPTIFSIPTPFIQTTSSSQQHISIHSIIYCRSFPWEILVCLWAPPVENHWANLGWSIQLNPGIRKHQYLWHRASDKVLYFKCINVQVIYSAKYITLIGTLSVYQHWTILNLKSFRRHITSIIHNLAWISKSNIFYSLLLPMLNACVWLWVDTPPYAVYNFITLK